MAITLAEAKVGMADKVDQAVVDEFRRSSLLLDSLTFDDSISPGTGGSTLTYGYMQLQTPSTAGVRAINAEYTAGEAKRVKKTADAIIMGGSFKLDRVLQNTSGAIDELGFQVAQKVKATSNEFHNLVINGTSASSGTGYVTNTFDGLKKLLASSDTEVSSVVDLSTSANTDDNYMAFLDEIDEFISLLDGKPTMLLMNTKMLSKVRACARRAGYYTKSEDAFGKPVENYNGIPMLDTGIYYNGTSSVEVIPTSTPTTSAYGTTAIYAVVAALDGFHGISPAGNKVITQYLPDMTQPGAVKTGEVELIAGVVLKNTKKAAVLKDIIIAPKATS